MKNETPSICKLALIVALVLASRASAADVDPKVARELYDRVAPSLVVVQYTYDGELGRRDIDGTGVVVSDDGLIVCSATLTPSSLPDEQMKDFKIVVPGADGDETELNATFLGRDERCNLSFIRA